MTEPAAPAWARDWAPVTESRRTHVAAHPVEGMSAWLDADDASAQPGRPLPPLWHWAALSQWPASASLGADGHPATGAFLPATPYPRRMWVGCTVAIARPPEIGAPAVVSRVVDSVTEKSGRHGDFALVTVRTTVTTPDDEQLLTEWTQLAYRAGATAASPADAGAPSDAQRPAGAWLRRTAPWSWQVQATPPVLMMFSALTANAHRIHYDAPYAREVEGYPSLLVHGPLMAIALAEVVRREQPDREVASISCRALQPLYLGTPGEIRRSEPAGQSDVQVELVTDGVRMTAAVSFADEPRNARRTSGS